MNYTIKDIARKAGVSIATVSRVMNGKDRVKDETRRKILSIIKETNFSTNFSARTLRSRRTNVIGVIVPEVAIPFWAQIVKGIENKANEYGLRLIVCDSENSIEKERDFIKFVYSRTVDGLILVFPTVDTAELCRMKQDRKPLVVFGKNMQEYNLPSVTVDNRLGAMLAVRHFYSHGLTKIAFIGGTRGGEVESDRNARTDGFIQAMQEYDLALRPEYMENGFYDEEGASGAFIRLMKLKNPPSAVFCGNDEMALGVLKASRQLGVKIPQEVGLIGFDNIPVCQYTSPTLTTINQPTYTIGSLCCEKLFGIISDADRSSVHVNLEIRPELVIRESCGC